MGDKKVPGQEKANTIIEPPGSAFWRFIFYDRIQELLCIKRGHNDALPPAAKTLFEKRVLDSQKLFIIRSFCPAFFKKRAAGGIIVLKDNDE